MLGGNTGSEEPPEVPRAVTLLLGGDHWEQCRVTRSALTAHDAISPDAGEGEGWGGHNQQRPQLTQPLPPGEWEGSWWYGGQRDS